MTFIPISLLSLGQFDLQSILVTVLVLTISLSFHEMAHAWAAYRLGDDTAALQGRLTMNPLAHLDPIGALVFMIAGIGWAKPVPINPSRFTRKISMKKGIMLTSLAGPSANIILAAIASILHAITAFLIYTLGEGNVLNMLGQLFYMMYYANTALAVFNLLPIPPLDGYKIFGAALPNEIYYRVMRFERYIGIVFLMLVMFGGGILSSILRIVRIPFDLVIWTPVHWVAQWLLQVIA
ncbi:MAG: site-2 protease family protein [Eubacteriales bacterium]|nr:site-2 protease family protein [Eubacteriales bacterium]